jgi:hypothetical protein
MRRRTVAGYRHFEKNTSHLQKTQVVPKSGQNSIRRPGLKSQKREYLNNNINNNNKVIQQKLAEAAEMMEDKSPYYRYTPANLLENDNFKLYWNRSIITDKTIPANRTDITLKNKKTKTNYLIDIAVPNTHSCPEHT